MRISPPAPGGLPRVVPSKGLSVGSYYIPGGVSSTALTASEGSDKVKTIVSEGSYVMHYNSEIYPEPHKFRPERWLDVDNKDLEKGFVPFSKGARNCIGIK
jgi:hypothetical protein